MNKELAELIISSWNGEDKYFLCDGAIYSEDDVHEADEFLTQLNK